jgi:hypothetical protein
MSTERFYKQLKQLSLLVLMLMGIAVLYAAVISVLHWPSIAV